MCLVLAANLVADSIAQTVALVKPILSTRVPGEPRSPRRVSISPDGSTVAATGNIREEGPHIFVWNILKTEPAAKMHKPRIDATMRFTPDGKNVVTMEGITNAKPPTAVFRRFSVASGNLEETIELPLWSRTLAISQSGRMAFAAERGLSKVGVIWSISDRFPQAKLEVESASVLSAVFSRDEKLILLCGSAGDGILREINSGKLVSKFASDPIKSSANNAIRFADISASNKHVIWWEARKIAYLFHVGREQPVAKFSQLECGRCRFTPDGKMLIVAKGNALEFRDVKDGQLVGVMECPKEDLRIISDFDISANGKYIALLAGIQLRVYETPSFKVNVKADGFEKK